MSVELTGNPLTVLHRDPLVVKNEKNWHHNHTYGGWSRFFNALLENKLLATRCTNPDCPEKSLWLPPRCQCPDCWHDTEWVEAPQEGTVYTHSTVLYPGALFRANTPCPLISVEIKGVCTKFMSYLKEGEPFIGMPIKAVFNTGRPMHNILDVAWVPREGK